MTERALTDNADDRTHVKQTRQREKQRAQRERTDLESLLSLVQGRRVLWGLLCDCGVFRLSLSTGQPDVTGFNEGQRSIGLKLMASIQALNPEYYHLMAKEAHDLDEQTKPGPSREKTASNPDTEETDHATH